MGVEPLPLQLSRNKSGHKDFSVPAADFEFTVGSARIAAYLGLPEVLREFGVDVQDVLEETGIGADLRISSSAVAADLDSVTHEAFLRALECDGGLLAREILRHQLDLIRRHF